MATATATPTVTSVSNLPSDIIVRGTIAISASPDAYAAGGLTLDLTKGFSPGSSLPANASPRACRIWSSKKDGTTLFEYKYNPQTNAGNGKLQLFAVETASDNVPLDELDDTTAIPASASGDTINYEAWFPKFA